MSLPLDISDHTYVGTNSGLTYQTDGCVMSMQVFERMMKQFGDLMKHLTGYQSQMQECRQCCPVKQEHPTQRHQQRRYYQ